MKGGRWSPRRKADRYLLILYVCVSTVEATSIQFGRLDAHRKTQGAGVFLLCYILTSVGLLLKMRGHVQKYLPVRWLGFLLADAANHVLSFLLFWCMAYTLVHIY